MKSHERDTKILHRILALSTNLLTLSPPLADKEEDLETVMRRRAERSFHNALCQKIYWQLSREDRSKIRATVLREHPHYQTHPESTALEWQCYEEVGKLLEAAKRG